MCVVVPLHQVAEHPLVVGARCKAYGHLAVLALKLGGGSALHQEGHHILVAGLGCKVQSCPAILMEV